MFLAGGLCVAILMGAAATGEYVPGRRYSVVWLFIMYYTIPQGTPGSVWSQEQVEVVRAKVREMVKISNWWVDRQISTYL